MSRSLNRVILLGNIGNPPQLQMSKTGKFYTRLSVATERYRGQEDGNGTEETEWHSVFVWGNQAENCVKYLGKGAMVLVEGALNYWTSNMEEVTGKKETTYKNAVLADKVRFITYGRKGEDLDIPQAARNHNAVAHPVM